MNVALHFAVSRTVVLPYCVIAAVALLGCSRKAQPTQATGGPIVSAASASASAAVDSRAALACKAKGSTFTLGPIGSERRNNDDSDNEGDGVLEDLPFGVSVGSAQAREKGFVISAIDARSDGNHAVLVLVDQEIAKGKVLDLGRVFGDAEPPRVILRGSAAFVVVPDGSASGGIYRYGWLKSLDTASPVQWLGSIDEHQDDSAVYSVAATDTTIALAWDDVERKSRLSHVNWGVTTATELAPSPQRRERSSPKSKVQTDLALYSTSPTLDAESPQLAAHRGGFWLAYLVGEPAAGEVTPPAQHGTSASRGAKSKGNDEVRPLDLGRRGILMQALDANGRTIGKAIPITERSAHVMTFEMAATADGGAMVAYRDADTAPGVEEQAIELVRVRADGGLVRQRLEDERIGAGVPTLLFDSAMAQNDAAPGAAWVAVASASGEMRVAKLSEPLDASPPALVDAPMLAGVDPMLRLGDSLLVARHRARVVEFEYLDCTWTNAQPSAGSAK